MGSRQTCPGKALHMKLRMRQEFPQTYAEARYQFTQPFAALNNTYGPKPLYLAAIGNGTGNPVDLTKEAAILMLAVLSQNRGGGGFNAEDGLPTDMIDYAGKTVKVLVDAWGTPMCMRRWATDDMS